MNSKRQPPTTHMPSGDVKHYGEHNLGAERSDPYQAKGKYREPTQCSDCGAVFHRGRWAWGTAGADADKALCPACRRIRDKLPAGTVELRGPFSVEHRQDLVRLVRNEAEREGKEHPLHRLMHVEEGSDRVDITTTDIHLPRRIGEALKRAYDGELDIKHGADEYTVRVHWYR